ncbi:MAG: hypothetical protein COB76_06810 [Alphaproteobacteria bacterium]|nr:MAG: hypothetical protein COB76_06810 [Alphaproteobacteria bacterium]
MIKKAFTSLILFGAFCTLFTLGFWQIERLEWKNDVIADIQTQSAKPLNELSLSNAPDNYTRGFIKGRRASKTIIFLAPRILDGKSGSHVLSPYNMKNGRTIMVNWGWVSPEDKDKITSLGSLSKINGFTKKEIKPPFSPDNRADLGLWYWADTKALGTFYKADLVGSVFFASNEIHGAITPINTIPLPRNKHLQYALFWFGMSGILVILTLILYRKSRV